MATTTRVKKHFLVYFFSAFLAILLALVMINRGAIAVQLDNWQVLPHSQGVTELYFTDDKLLPEAVRAESTQVVNFAVHNLEQAVTPYHYKVLATEEGSSEGKLISDGMIQLDHDELHIVSEAIKIPLVSAARVAITVELEYEGVPFGSKELKAQHQAVHYWVKVVGPQA